MKKLIFIPFIIFTFFGCTEDDTENNGEVVEIDIPDELAVYVNVEIPENTSKEEYILLDNKNRELPINNTENIKAEENTIVSLIKKDTDKIIYIAYILEENTNSKANNSGSKSYKSNGVCDNTNVVGVRSTAKFILANIINPISIFHVGNSDKDSFFEIFQSNILCGTFSEEQILSLENVVDQLVAEGKDFTEIAVSTAIQTIVAPITGGLFADCWEIGTGLILNGEIELEAHPYQEYLISLEFYNSDNPSFPYIIDEFTNVLPNGVIIKEATPLDDGNWKIIFDAYNSLPIPLGVRVGKLQNGTDFVIVPADNETNFFINSSGSSVIQMIQNGVTCEGFVNNAFDSYYTTVTEGLAIRSSDFEKTEVELVFNPENEYVLFQGPNENASVRIYHIMESLSHFFDIIQIGDKLAEVEKKNIKIEILNNILSDSETLNEINSNSNNLKTLQKIIGTQMMNYMEESIEDGASNIFSNLLNQYNIDKSAVSKNLKIIKTALDVIDNINYADAWSKIDNYTATVQDYKLHIPNDDIEVSPVTNPSPQNDSTNISLNGNLSFTEGNNTPTDATFKVYFDTNANPNTVFDLDANENSLAYSNLQETTTYYWKVETISSTGNVLATSPIWSFTTATNSGGTAVVDVTNPITGRTWMDRNLGASRAAILSTDELAYGDLYQWGRGTDGHEKRSSPTTTSISTTNQPSHGSFIKCTFNSNFDWLTPQNDNLWQGVNGINNPCPSGYRLPTQQEWEAERMSWISDDASGAFNSPLKLSLAGNRRGPDGFLASVGFSGNYWSSTTSGNDAIRLTNFNVVSGIFTQIRAEGQSVRCIKN